MLQRWMDVLAAHPSDDLDTLRLWDIRTPAYVEAFQSLSAFQFKDWRTRRPA